VPRVKLLLTVEDTFQITGRGLVVAPAIESTSRASNFSGAVTIRPPAGDAFQTHAEFAWTHFRPSGMKLLLTFPGLSKESVPIGSRVYFDGSELNESA
jgi:hypothetical protein